MRKSQFKIVKKDFESSNAKAACDIVKMWIDGAANGEYVLTMEKVKSQRTISQNKLMWLWFNIIASAWSEATGRWITPQNVHDTYCELFLPVETPRGRVGGNTSGLNVEDMTEFLQQVQADAASEYGIMLPAPDDENIHLWENEYDK